MFLPLAHVAEGMQHTRAVVTVAILPSILPQVLAVFIDTITLRSCLLIHRHSPLFSANDARWLYDIVPIIRVCHVHAPSGAGDNANYILSSELVVGRQRP